MGAEELEGLGGQQKVGSRHDVGIPQNTHPGLWGQGERAAPDAQLSCVARGGREPGGQGRTATWKRLDGNHLAWAECGLQRGRSRSRERGHGGRVDGGLGLGGARPEAPTF